MKECTSISEFLHEIPATPAYVEASTDQISGVWQAVKSILKEHPERPIEEAIKDFHSVCPSCGAWMPSSRLCTLSIAQRYDSVDGPITRHLGGLCQNDGCSCRKTMLVWKGCQELLQHVDRHLARVIVNADKKGLRCFGEELRQQHDVLAFVTDCMWALRRRVTTAHMFNSHVFSDLCVTVSVIPVGPHLAKDVFFSEGYEAFLDELLDTCGWDNGKTSLAHFMLLGDGLSILPSLRKGDMEWHLSMAICSPKYEASEDRFLLLPEELSSKRGPTTPPTVQ